MMEAMSKHPKILLRMPNWLGDAVMAAPLIEVLRRKYPDAHLTLWGLPAVVQLFANDPRVDTCLTLQKEKGWRRYNPWRADLCFLREQRYDLAYVLPNSFSSAWELFCTRAKKRVGYHHDARGFLLNAAQNHPKNKKTQHLVLTYLELVRDLEVDTETLKPQLFVPSNASSYMDAFRQEHQLEGLQLLGVNPCAAYGPAKCWLPERFAKVSTRLLEEKKDLAIVFSGDPASSDLVEQIVDQIPETLRSRVVNTAGKTNLEQLLILIEASEAFLTNDSGPMHIAAALNKPTIALFGSTDATVTGPYSPRALVLQKKVDCSPCFLRNCPIDFRCMKRLEEEEVYAAVKGCLVQRGV